MQSALSLKQLYKQAKKDLQKSQHQVADSFVAKEALSQRLEGLNNQRRQIEQNDKQVIDHYSKLREEAI